MIPTLAWWSGTGNSLWLARQLGKSLGEHRLLPIARVLCGRETIPSKVERLVLIFPVYMWSMPLAVGRFIELETFPQTAHITALINYGGSAGATLRSCAARIANRGGQLALGMGLRMPGNYTPLYGAESEARQARCFCRAQERLPQLAAGIRAGRIAPPARPGPIARALSRLLGRIGTGQIPRLDKGFRRTSRCVGCGLCTRICPVRNILPDGNGGPIWQHHCEQCFACLQWCPTGAIEYTRITSGRKRYHHPEVRAQDLMLADKVLDSSEVPGDSGSAIS